MGNISRGCNNSRGCNISRDSNIRRDSNNRSKKEGAATVVAKKATSQDFVRTQALRIPTGMTKKRDEIGNDHEDEMNMTGEMVVRKMELE